MSSLKGSYLNTITAIVSIFLTIFFDFTTSCNRYRYFGESCIGYQDQEVCDSSRMLKCDLRTGTCQCPDFYYHFWDNYQKRCYHKIGTACSESFGGVSESWYNHGCPVNSFCNPGSGYCQCRPLFNKNYDGTACFGNQGSRSQINLEVTITSLVFSIFTYGVHFHLLN